MLCAGPHSSTAMSYITRPSPSPPPLMFYLLTTPVPSCDASSSALSCHALSCAVVLYFALPGSDLLHSGLPCLPCYAVKPPALLCSAPLSCIVLRSAVPALQLSSQPSYVMLTCPLLHPAVATQRQVVRSCYYQIQKQD